MDLTTIIAIVACIVVLLQSIAIKYLLDQIRSARQSVKKLAPIVAKQQEQQARLQGKTIIYAISDPLTKEICYVGMTMKSAETRLREHVDEAKCVSRFHLHIRDRMAMGHEWTDVQVLEACDTRAEAYRREQYWITRGKTELEWPLLNGARQRRKGE